MRHIVIAATASLMAAACSGGDVEDPATMTTSEEMGPTGANTDGANDGVYTAPGGAATEGTGGTTGSEAVEQGGATPGGMAGYGTTTEDGAGAGEDTTP